MHVTVTRRDDSSAAQPYTFRRTPKKGLARERAHKNKINSYVGDTISHRWCIVRVYYYGHR